MAKSNNNVITHGLSGKIGDLLVFRQVRGKTVVSKMPQMPAKSSESQQAHHRRFQQGVLYGKAAVNDPATSGLYAERAAAQKRTAFNVAVADFFNAPDIEHVDISDYTGQPGDIIRIRVHDDFMVKSVTVNIANADGSLVEEGEAQPDASGYVWTYTATQANESLDGDRIAISASDMPGNITRGEQEL